MSANLTLLRDCKSGEQEFIELSTGRVYADSQGLKHLRNMVPDWDFVLGEGNRPITMRDGSPIECKSLARIAAMHLYRRMAEQMLPGQQNEVLAKLRHDVGDIEEAKAMGLVDREDHKVLLDLGVTDVHQPATLGIYAGGYRIAEGAADVISPPILVPKQQDYYFQWNQATDFDRKNANGSAPGAEVQEVNPVGAFTLFTAQPYALGGFIPTEIQANADAPIRPYAKLVQMVVDALLLEREYRVQAQLATTSSWQSSLVNTLASGSQWDGGAASDPIANLHKAIEQSYMDPTGILMSELVMHDFLRNAAVQKYFTYKDKVDGLPDPAALSSTFHLPPIYVAKMKYQTGGTPSYVWGNNCYLFRQPKEMPPTSQMDITTALTFRWNGAGAPDEERMTAGFLVRSFFDQKRGPRGGTKVVVTHNDAEVMPSGLVGGLIVNAHI